MRKNKKGNHLKVLHLLNELCYSGAEVMLRDASKFFADNGIEATILSTGHDTGPYAATLKKCGYTVEHIPFRKSFGYFSELYGFLKANGFDVVHIHPERANFYHALTARLAGQKRIIRTVHDVFFQYNTYKRQVRKLQRYIARKWLSVSSVAIGDSVHEVELSNFANPTEIIYNWIDEEAFRPASEKERLMAKDEFHLRENDFVLCTVGTCNDKKRHKDIFESIARVKKRIPSIVLLHRGTGPDTKEEVSYVRKLGIEENVRFIDYVDFLPKVFWASDGFIFSSKWEGLGDVIIEAIACGLPVILCDGYGMKDFKPTQDKMFGYWLDPQSQTFDFAILDLFEKRETLIPQFQANARSFFAAKFSRTKSLQKLVNLYRGNAI